MIPIETEKRIDWNTIRAEYIGGASYGVLSKRHSLTKSTIFKKSKKEGWDDLRKRTANAVETETIQRTAEIAADNASIAQELKKKLLLRLKRIEEKYPYDATEVRAKQGNNYVTFRIRDLTAAYKELTEDMQTGNKANNELLEALLDLERRAGV